MGPALLLAALCLSGCGRFGFQGHGNDGSSPVETGAADLTAAERPADLDLGVGPETSPADLWVAPDQTAPPADLWVAPDQTTPPADLSVQDIGNVSGACHVGDTTKVDSKMVFCTSVGQGADQCQAGTTFCNAAAGWSLCTASQYRARFQSQPAPVTHAWIAGCIRDGGSPFPPTDGICGNCTFVTGASAYYHFSCAGAGGTGSGMLYVGLTSADVCAIVGVNTTANQAYWLPSGSSQAWYSAACCLP